MSRPSGLGARPPAAGITSAQPGAGALTEKKVPSQKSRSSGDELTKQPSVPCQRPQTPGCAARLPKGDKWTNHVPKGTRSVWKASVLSGHTVRAGERGYSEYKQKQVTADRSSSCCLRCVSGGAIADSWCPKISKPTAISGV